LAKLLNIIVVGPPMGVNVPCAV